MDQDRNLLFGVFAVQLKKVAASQIMAAAGAWAADPSKDLPERLLAEGVLTPSDRDLIQGLVDHAVNVHDGDATKTLATFGGDEQIEETFCGSIIRSGPGQLSLAPAQQPTVLSKPEEPLGLSETPGRYTRESEHARGGMGRVLLVHDEYIGRDIALKELLPSLWSSERGETPDSPVRATAHFVHRFLQEARVTGQLEHPSIVPVYELGRRTDGTVYYTMKLVKGKSLSQAIKDGNSLRERLKLLPHFVDLCQAIAYAHSRGVIHRDIKPGNVMVGEFGETVVIDWGLAKVLGKEDIHAKGFDEAVQQISRGASPEEAGTVYGQAIGTPAYMPPEQAKGQLDLVDQRSDAYSLGAVLYELLTGEAPFKGESLGSILTKVVNESPTPINQIVRDAPAELVAICEHAMHKQAERRYGSPKDLADEVQRFLDGAVVQTYQYSVAEYSKRLFQHNKGAFAAGAVGLIAVIAISTIGYFQVALERNDALASRDRAEAAEERAEAQKAMALEAFQTLTYEVPDTFGDIPEARPRLIAMMERNVEDLDRLLAMEPDTFEVRFMKASSLQDTGRRWRTLGELDKAIAAYQGAKDVYEELLKEDPDNAYLANGLASLLHGWSWMFGMQGDRDAATAAFEQSKAISERLVQQYPDNTVFAERLASLYSGTVDLLRQQQAMAIWERLVEQEPDNAWFAKDLAGGHNNMGSILSREQGKSDEALASFQQAKTIYERLVQQYPENADYADGLAAVHNRTGTLFSNRGDSEAALAAYQQARTIRERLVLRDPDNVGNAGGLAWVLRNIGSILSRNRGKSEEALATYQQSKAIWEGLLQHDPDQVDFSNALAVVHMSMGVLFQGQGKNAEALDAYQHAKTILEPLLQQDPDNVEYATRLGQALQGVAFVSVLMRDSETAIEHFVQSYALFRSLVEQNPRSELPWGDADPKGISQLPMIALLLAGQYARLNRHEEGLKLVRDYRELCDLRYEANPENSRARRGRVDAMLRLGNACRKQDLAEEARGLYEEAIILLRDMIATSPANRQTDLLLRQAQSNLKRLGVSTPD